MSFDSWDRGKSSNSKSRNNWGLSDSIKISLKAFVLQIVLGVNEFSHYFSLKMKF